MLFFVGNEKYCIDRYPKKRRGQQQRKPKVYPKSTGEQARTLSMEYALRGATTKAKPDSCFVEPPPKKPLNYAAYIKSPQWRMFRLTIIAKRGYQCENCSCNRPPLQLHHKTYIRLTKELPEDVELLCDDCHRASHGLDPAILVPQKLIRKFNRLRPLGAIAWGRGSSGKQRV